MIRPDEGEGEEGPGEGELGRLPGSGPGGGPAQPSSDTYVFLDERRPALDAGEYELRVRLEVRGVEGATPEARQAKFWVGSERFPSVRPRCTRCIPPRGAGARTFTPCPMSR